LFLISDFYIVVHHLRLKPYGFWLTAPSFPLIPSESLAHTGVEGEVGFDDLIERDEDSDRSHGGISAGTSAGNGVLTGG
jgi:hypothetical protein